MAVAVILRPAPIPHTHPAIEKLVRRSQDPSAPRRETRLSERELAELYAPAADEVRRVVHYGQAYGLRPVRASRVRHDVTFEGVAGQMERAFGVQLYYCQHAHGRHRFHEDDVELPLDLRDLVEDVVGLDETPRYHPFSIILGRHHEALSPLELAEHYRFPAQLDGSGQRIAIIALGGGYYRRDVDAYFRQHLRIPAPVVREVPVLPGCGSQPLPWPRLREMAEAFSSEGADLGRIRERFGADLGLAMMDFETTQDVQIAGALANGAEIDVYFSRGDDAGLYCAIYAALGLGGPFFQRRQLPAAISLSWGLSECAAYNKSGAMRIAERALEKARLLDVPVICAAGDFGSYGSNLQACGCEMASVCYPASSPSTLACGGTQFHHDAQGRRYDVVWNAPNRGLPQATGGGVSGRWPRPPHQRHVAAPTAAELGDRAWLHGDQQREVFVGRGVPDVSAYANPVGGYQALIGGVPAAGGGTSAATPLWAGLCARLRQRLGDCMPWLNDAIYRPEFQDAFGWVERGDNDLSNGRAASFQAGHGWDCCSGLGVPNGERLLERLEDLYGVD